MNEKIEQVTDHITRGHLTWAGGYPYPSAWAGDTFIWCDIGTSVDDMKYAAIRMLGTAELLAWHARATAWLEDNPSEDGPGEGMREALQETWPEMAESC
jgi:hypothetical protein